MLAIIECTVTHTCQIHAEIMISKMRTVIECSTTNMSDSVQISDLRQILAPPECAVANISQLTRAQIHSCQFPAINESTVAHLHHRCRNEYGVQILTISKSVGANPREMRRQGYRLHGLVASQLPTAYFSYPCEILKFIERGNGVLDYRTLCKRAVSEKIAQTGH